jgi:hypothetical protein
MGFAAVVIDHASAQLEEPKLRIGRVLALQPVRADLDVVAKGQLQPGPPLWPHPPNGRSGVQSAQAPPNDGVNTPYSPPRKPTFEIAAS